MIYAGPWREVPFIDIRQQPVRWLISRLMIYIATALGIGALATVIAIAYSFTVRNAADPVPTGGVYDDPIKLRKPLPSIETGPAPASIPVAGQSGRDVTGSLGGAQGSAVSEMRTLGGRGVDAPLDLPIGDRKERLLRDELARTVRELSPVKWANAQAVLGDAMRENNHLQGAISAYQKALEVYTRESFPVQFASIQRKLGDVLSLAGRYSKDYSQLERAIQAYNAALSGEAFSQKDRLDTQDQLAATEKLLLAATDNNPLAGARPADVRLRHP